MPTSALRRAHPDAAIADENLSRGRLARILQRAAVWSGDGLVAVVEVRLWWGVTVRLGVVEVRAGSTVREVRGRWDVRPVGKRRPATLVQHELPLCQGQGRGDGDRLVAQPCDPVAVDVLEPRQGGGVGPLTAQHRRLAAVRRREGLYQSQIREWTIARDALVRGAIAPRRAHRASGAGGKDDPGRLRAENQRLTRELATSQAVVEIMGKLQGLLEQISESTPATSSSRAR